MFAKFLVPINPDDREIASGILPHVTWLARTLASEVVFLSVIPIDRTEDGPETAQIFDQAEGDVARRLNGLVESIKGPGLRWETLVEFGSPAETIVDTCNRLACDTIAMSTHGGGLLAQVFAGSVTTEVIASAQVPVVVINPARSDVAFADAVGISTIYVALDGTPEAEAVLPHVEFLAAKLGLEVVLLRAVDEIAKQSPSVLEATEAILDETGELGSQERPGVVVTGDATLVANTDIATELSIDYFTQITEDLMEKGLNARWVLLEGHAKERLLEVFEGSARNMIAVTHSGRSGLKRWVLGSVSEELINKTGNPVLVVPTGAQR
jgi:nucleotide-binding universal stress UspA family protein